MSILYTLPLQHGMLTLVDLQDYKKFKDHRWSVTGSQGGRCGYVTRFAVCGGNRLQVKLHRLIMKAQKGEAVDHINGDPLDNRRSNLRLATQKQNAMNMAGHRRGTSKYKGVCWYKFLKVWRSQIYVEGKNIWLGDFSSEERAAKEYNKAAKLYFGIYARS